MLGAVLVLGCGLIALIWRVIRSEDASKLAPLDGPSGM